VPLATVLFLVFAFFGLGFRFTVQPGVQVNAPLSAFSLRPQPNTVTTTIGGGPVPIVYFEDERITIELLPAKLDKITAGERSLIIKADRSTPYELVMQAANEGLKRGFSVVLATGEER
jgi:biopolymer transport protein ExbD